MEKDILLWRFRVVISPSQRFNLLKQVHQTHLGIVKTKSICRSYFLWPGLDNENLIVSCDACLSTLPNRPKASTIPWNDINEPWSRLHVNYAGPFKGFYYFVILNAYSKWILVFPSWNMTTDFTITKLRETFARFGLPKVVVSDNGC